MLKLFDDQQEVMDEVKAAMRVSRSVLLQSPTGSGKTAMACDMVISAARKNKRVLFSVPLRDLMEQTSNTFKKNGIKHGFIAAGKDFNPFAQVYIGMVDTMANRIESLPKKIDLYIPDEVHYGADALGSVIDFYKEQRAWIVGLSATPWKMNGQGLGVHFDTMVQGKSIRWLIDNGRLSDYRYFYGKTREHSEQTRGMTEEEAASYMEQKREIIGDCVRDYRERCMGRLHIVRCSSIKHSKMTADAFRREGIPAAHVDGETPHAEKYAIFKAFARREILVLTFANLLNFGFDLSQATGMDVCIESCSDLKISKSLASQMQFWGRVLRWKPYPAIIKEHVNNYLTHGLPCSDRNWSLFSHKEASGGKAPPTKQCPRCFFVHSPAPKCPECGKVYEVNSRSTKVVDGSLHEIDIMANRNNFEIDNHSKIALSDNVEDLERLIKYARDQGKKNPIQWAAKELAKRMQVGYV